MNPPKLLTVDQIQHWKDSLPNDAYDIPLPGETWIVDRQDFERLLATALAALKVVEAADKAVALIGWDDGTSGRELQAALKPFQQTGEDIQQPCDKCQLMFPTEEHLKVCKGGRGDE